jgi:hypothetical protein
MIPLLLLGLVVHGMVPMQLPTVNQGIRGLAEILTRFLPSDRTTVRLEIERVSDLRLGTLAAPALVAGAADHV